MNIFKYLGLILIILVFLFFIMGLIRPSVHYGHTIIVDKPVSEAWAVHQDISKYDQWLDGFQSIQLIEGEKNTVGSKYRVTVIPRDGEAEFIMNETIESFVPNDHISLNFDSEMMQFDQTTRFVDKGRQTVISTESKVTGKTFITRCLFSSMETIAGMFQSKEVENIENLKNVINQNIDQY